MILLYKALAALALALAIAAIGYTVGHSSGYAAGQESQQATIKKLTDGINDAALAANNKISQLEQDSANSVSKVHTLELNNMQAKSSIITKYQTEYVAGVTKCALSNETIKAVNELIAVDNMAFDSYVASMSSNASEQPVINNNASVKTN
jgi:hypothetical protein